MIVNVILFPHFETLDVFGPVEIFGKMEGALINFYSQDGGLVGNKDNVLIDTASLSSLELLPEVETLFIPGGMGTRQQVENQAFIERLQLIASISKYVLTVCTGSALLAKTGLLDGLRATSNKRALDWVMSCNSQVNWVSSARWVVDGKYYTSSGVSAGIDMALGFVADRYGNQRAEDIADHIEYAWNKDKDYDRWAK